MNVIFFHSNIWNAYLNVYYFTSFSSLERNKFCMCFALLFRIYIVTLLNLDSDWSEILVIKQQLSSS